MLVGVRLSQGEKRRWKERVNKTDKGTKIGETTPTNKQQTNKQQRKQTNKQTTHNTACLGLVDAVGDNDVVKDRAALDHPELETDQGDVVKGVEGVVVDVVRVGDHRVDPRAYNNVAEVSEMTRIK